MPRRGRFSIARAAADADRHTAALSAADAAVTHPSTCPLIRAVLAPATARAYTNAVIGFMEWCERHGYEYDTIEQLDISLSRYVVYLYELGVRVPRQGGKTHAVHVVCGIRHLLPSLDLPIVDRRLRGWHRLQPSASPPPLTFELTCLIAATMAHSGFHAHSIASLLAFDCYLRIGELVGLTVSDVARIGDHRLPAGAAGTMALRFLTTKTGKHQFVQIDRDVIGRLLSVYLDGKDGSKSVFGLTAAGYRRVFHSVLAALDLGHVGYTPHSLRHGGATTDALSGRSVESILLRGRWASNASARTYVQSGRSRFLSADVLPSAAALGMEISQDLYGILRPLLPALV